MTSRNDRHGPARLRPVAGAWDVVAVAFQRAMSKGPISRRLGWFGLVLQPLTIPVQVPTVVVGGDQVLRLGSAPAMRGRVVKIRPAAAGAAVLGPVALIVVLLAIDSLTGLSAGWVSVIAFIVIVVELAGSLPARGVRLAWRRLRGGPARRGGAPLSALDPQSAAPITFVVAFPRGDRRGSTLLSDLETMLDTDGQVATLTARTDWLIAFYAEHGFRSFGSDPRQMIRQPKHRPH